jgi:hypothetical protein
MNEECGTQDDSLVGNNVAAMAMRLGSEDFPTRNNPVIPWKLAPISGRVAQKESGSTARERECSPRGRSWRGHDTGSLKQQTARNGVRALSSDVSTLISRGLQRLFKNVRNMLNMNHLRNIMQVFDFLRVRNKNGDFRCVSHP